MITYLARRWGESDWKYLSHLMCIAMNPDQPSRHSSSRINVFYCLGKSTKRHKNSWHAQIWCTCFCQAKPCPFGGKSPDFLQYARNTRKHRIATTPTSGTRLQVASKGKLVPKFSSGTKSLRHLHPSWKAHLSDITSFDLFQHSDSLWKRTFCSLCVITSARCRKCFSVWKCVHYHHPHCSRWENIVAI